MHLNHKIPWNTVSSHFLFVKENPYKNRETDFIIHDRLVDCQGGELKYFTGALIAAIEEFATTERAKYPAPKDLPKAGPLFDASVLTSVEQKYHLEPHRTNSATSNPLCENFRDVEIWIKHAPYSTKDGDLADAVKMLLVANEMVALLRLANHEKVPLVTLDNLHWGHSFGVRHLADVALEAYLLLNIAAAVKANAKSGSANESVCLTRTKRFKTFTNWALADFDYPVQNIPHRLFWGARSITDNHIGDWDPLSLQTDQERKELREYLKMCFELLYRYDLLMKEMGCDPDWNEKILGILRMWGAKSVVFTETGYGFA
ncbi:hypothetical protein BDV25DRAFT_153387 [Aspergillus avenaceus]|uniref:Uncharacterized protein n=1 Tax=Aspergillus avenaceus TaxID=36643 RepID=A0A5N6TXF9_ASPAV|nr:hypothetical protein BDV25DRAFT_153387 [Aspergillus avenaceus]